MNSFAGILACQKVFEAGRSDKQYCGNACRMAHSRARKKHHKSIEAKKAAFERPIREEIKRLKSENEKLRRSSLLRFNSKVKTEKGHQLERRIDYLQRFLELSDSEFYNAVLNPNVLALHPYCPEGVSWLEFFETGGHSVWVNQQLILRCVAGLQEVDQNKTKIAVKRAEVSAKIAKLKEQLLLETVPDLSNLREVNRKSKLIGKNLARIRELESQLDNPPDFSQNQEREKRIRKPGRKKPRKLSGEVSPADLKAMEFDTFKLESELGEFLGDLERNMLAFALTGDSGVGKSTFSYQLAKLFLDHGLNAKYFSLEEGVGRLTKEKVSKAKIDDDAPLSITGKGTLREVRAAAKQCDLILIDSFQKLGAKPEEFDRLRQDFPETIFIVIFQKTTTGKIRGGSMIRYDSAATINLTWEGNERVAIMEKSRYGTQSWVYSLNRNAVIYDGQGPR